MYKANIVITLRPSILDPQGKATQRALAGTGFSGVEHVRIGKYIEVWIEASDEAEARHIAEQACRRLLANAVMEDYRVDVEAVSPEAAARLVHQEA